MKSKKKRNLESAISYYEAKLAKELTDFRECAQKYNVEQVTGYLPMMILNIQETNKQLKRLQNKLQLLKLLENTEENPSM